MIREARVAAIALGLLIGTGVVACGDSEEDVPVVPAAGGSGGEAGMGGGAGMGGTAGLGGYAGTGGGDAGTGGTAGEGGSGGIAGSGGGGGTGGDMDAGPDAEPDAMQPDAEPDATQPDAEPDATQPDAEPDATQPDAEPDATQPDGGTGCTEITIQGVTVLDPSYAYIFSYGYTPNTGDTNLPDEGWIEFWSNESTGTFDLSVDPDDSYATCEHCVRVFEDIDQDNNIARQYFQSSGTMEITDATDLLNGVSAGSLTDVTLVEVTIDPNTYESTPVADGSCLHISSFQWDTTPSVGTDCQTGESCGAGAVCSVETELCALSECSTSDDCADTTDHCLAQSDPATAGACYGSCTPFAGSPGCDSGYECVLWATYPQDGICFKYGAAAEGEACDPSPSDVSTGCEAGLNCEGGTCVAVCNYWGNTQCATGRCTFAGTCTETGEDVAEGETCAAAASYCLPEGENWSGYCLTEQGSSTATCYRLCRVGHNNDCPGNSTCDDSFGFGAEGLGSCI